MTTSPGPTAPTGPTAPAGPTASAGLAGRYLLGGLLGTGSTATVHRAHDRITGEQVAIKVFDRRASAPDGLPAHRRETATLAALHHPGIVEIHRTGVDDGRTYLVMRLVDGESLAQRIARGPSPVDDVAAVGARLADALAHVHEHGIVHRDVKPANILLDAARLAHLTDFGIARLLDATRATATGISVGTPAFMSPEQVRGLRVGPPTDVYALGLTLLETLTGRREYPGTVVESALARLTRAPRVPRDLPDPLRTLLTAMTADDPADRPTAHAVATALGATLEAPVITGARPPAARRRVPGRVLAAAAAALVGVVGLGTLGLGAGGPAAPPATAQPAAAQPAAPQPTAPQPATAQPSTAQPVPAPDPGPVAAAPTTASAATTAAASVAAAPVVRAGVAGPDPRVPTPAAADGGEAAEPAVARPPSSPGPAAEPEREEPDPPADKPGKGNGRDKNNGNGKKGK